MQLEQDGKKVKKLTAIRLKKNEGDFRKPLMRKMAANGANKFSEICDVRYRKKYNKKKTSSTFSVKMAENR